MAKRRAPLKKPTGKFTGTGTVRLNVKKNDLEAEVNRAVRSFEGKSLKLGGGITIDGHSYWVILEYGSSPAERNPGPKPSDEIVLTLPPLPRAKNHDEPYEIHKAGRRVERVKQPYQTKKMPKPIMSNHLRRFLKFKGGDGTTVFAEVVHHPGVEGRGIIRRILAATQRQFIKDIGNISNWYATRNRMPDRNDFVEVMNEYLRDSVRMLRMSIPYGDEDKFLVLGEDAGHLADAIDAIYVK